MGGLSVLNLVALLFVYYFICGIIYGTVSFRRWQLAAPRTMYPAVPLMLRDMQVLALYSLHCCCITIKYFSYLHRK